MFTSKELSFLHTLLLSVNYPPDGIDAKSLASRLGRDAHRATAREAVANAGGHEFVPYPDGHAHAGSCVQCGLLDGIHPRHAIVKTFATIRALDDCIDQTKLLQLPEVKVRFENLRAEFWDLMESQLAELTRRSNANPNE